MNRPDIKAPRRAEAGLPPALQRRLPWGRLLIFERDKGWVLVYQDDSGWNETVSGPHESAAKASERAMVVRGIEWDRYGRGGLRRQRGEPYGTVES